MFWRRGGGVVSSKLLMGTTLAESNESVYTFPWRSWTVTVTNNSTPGRISCGVSDGPNSSLCVAP